MKASEEFSADLFIGKCIKRGISYRDEIVTYAAKQKSEEFASRVDDLIRNGKSKVYEKDEEFCSVHEVEMLYDQKQKEFYCPFCS